MREKIARGIDLALRFQKFNEREVRGAVAPRLISSSRTSFEFDSIAAEERQLKRLLRK
jgi:hypothetical protein